MRQWAEDYFQLSKNKWTKWDVTAGEYEFQLYIPVDLPDLSFLRRWDVREYVQSIRDWIRARLPDEDWTILDTVYLYKPSMDVYNWIPPFKSESINA